MFNHRLVITRRSAATAALTIVLGVAARTPSALALAPPPEHAPLFAAPYPAARALATARAEPARRTRSAHAVTLTESHVQGLELCSC